MKKVLIAFIAFVSLVCLVFQSCKKDDPKPDPNTGTNQGGSANQMTDSRDNKTYKTVKIGDQTWMAENLNYQSPSTGHAYCYEDKTDSCTKYGALYTWRAAQVACPNGWSLPTDRDWQNLEFALGMAASDTNVVGSYRGSDLGTKLKEGGSSGFNGKLSGVRYYNIGGGIFSDAGFASGFWTSTKDQNPNFPNMAYSRSIEKTKTGILRTTYDTTWAICVRCIKN